ncbi:hypothetical protein VTP01DRAFT_3093 [Rhizomucor pusillus]|uniref:uncharacterized protein n=1 Tax=Rhizomucor pusillus TaxID=4840 RepID=UPI0037445177
MSSNTTKEWLRFGLNTIGLASNIYGFSFVINALPPAPGFGGIFQFLTMIGLTMATLSFALKVLRSLVPGFLTGLHKTVVYVATPLEGLITLLYWPMIFYSRDMLAHQETPFMLPLVPDMSLHFWPAVVLWADFLIFDIEFQRSKQHVAIIYIFSLVYFFWTWYCFSRNGFWPYPFLAQLSHYARAMLFMFCGNVCIGVYEFGAFVHKKIHGRKFSVTEKSAKKE